MSRKKTVAGDTKTKAAQGPSADANSADGSQLFERIVPVPHIDTYSEVPFALVQRNGEPVLGDDKPMAAKAPARSNRKAPAKRAAKATKKKTTARAGKKAKAAR